MTIWKNKEELPDFDREFLEVYKDNSKNIEEFVSENKARKYYLSTPDAIMPSFTVYSELDDDVVKWCYLDDLLALEQRLKDVEKVIKKAIWYIERVEQFSEPIADESFVFCIKAQDYLNKIQRR